MDLYGVRNSWATSDVNQTTRYRIRRTIYPEIRMQNATATDGHHDGYECICQQPGFVLIRGLDARTPTILWLLDRFQR